MTTDLTTLTQILLAESANEAETRHKIIDQVLHPLLAWPRALTKVEEYISPGFADYVLTKPNGDFLFLVEAKKVGKAFELPFPHNEGETHCYIDIKTLLSNQNIRETMRQVRDYCMDVGCEYAAITNGIEWVAFKCFEKGKRWDQLKAFVIRSPKFFEEDEIKAKNAFSYIAITEHSSLTTTLSSTPPGDRQVFVAKDRVSAYSHPISANRLASALRPIASRHFGVIADEQTELMDRCYVTDRNFTQVLSGMRSIIKDSLTPYFEEYGVEQLEDTGKGGAVGGRITKNIKNSRGGEVLVLFGGKGAGKSTFIRRLLKHTPPRWLRENAISAVVDMLDVPEEKSRVHSEIWKRLVSGLDADKTLLASRETLLRELFSDRFETASRQELAGLSRSSDLYNDRLNGLVASWKADMEYCAVRLADRCSKAGKGVVVVIDNTDQYSGPIQDYCFTTAQEIARSLSCVTLISMREERFHNSKIHGVLDAFQNSGFHLSSPKPSTVFLKRLEYTIELLRDDARRGEITYMTDPALIDDCCRYLEIVASGIGNSESPLNSFLTACGHGDIRLTLDLFRSFLLSGYTNVQEMLDVGRWNFQIHQVIKPVMVPTRYFYDEQLSDIPNIFQARHNRLASHFTSLRILRRLSKNIGSGSSDFVAMAELRAYFSERFRMLGDFNLCMDVLLRHGFVEANNRLDYFDESVDRVRVTNYGLYMLSNLAFTFTYLDLVCVDCNYYDEESCNSITSYANEEYRLFTSRARADRVKVRLDRTESFISYLANEEKREIELFELSIPEGESFGERLQASFGDEKQRVLASAAKQKYNR
ncbi:putative type IV restriction endonuclease [Jannaschia seosinensis]|uniref:Putative type IV restriction endonuclease n=1 Tax=Jannaschia seosinensis TaxID=313367 RepID=A0A0M7B8H6_9RHOB|nr:hypothetical protein [Jannaschia seosinensis]CUH36634.1 putative type IV restriction endonuclease [Jannaschia seosinensis]